MGFKPRSALALSDPWRDWVVTALQAGSPLREIVRELVVENTPRALAEREVELIAWTLSRASRRGRRAELALRLLEEAKRRQPLSEVALCEEAEFYDRYFATNSAVVFRGGAMGLGVVGKWTPEYLAERGGQKKVKVSLGRVANPTHFSDPEKHYGELPVQELVDRVMATEESNDVYLVSRNRASQGALAALADDFVQAPSFLESDIRAGGWSLWFGPKGTQTPLHHDTTPILFCQIYGRKRLVLASPCERELLFSNLESTFYPSTKVSELDVHLHTVVVQPGDAVFIPVGWWHAVTALDVSISLSLTGFKPHVDYDWFRPGDIS